MTFAAAVRLLIEETTRYISPIAVSAEWVIVLAVAVAVVLIPFFPANRGHALWRSIRALASRRTLAIAICGLLPVVIRLSLVGIMPVPEPSIHDEFSHLLLADTLTHGRLSNPTPPMWHHFESIHIIQRPTYSSMYPPAQGSVLALGQVLFHQPWAGVVISVGLMTAATCWMMQGWMPPVWAFPGTIILILKIGIFGLYMNSYLGGAVPATGGALLIGSLPRLLNGARTLRYSLLFGLGLVILMNSRPLEGAVLGAAASVYLLIKMIRTRRQFPAVVAPAAVVVACGFLLMGYYNFRVTGNSFRMPYAANRDQYGWPENLAILPAKSVKLTDPVLAKMYEIEVDRRDIYRSPKSFVQDINFRVLNNWVFFIGPVLTVPLLFLPWAFRKRQRRLLLVLLALVALLNLLQLVLYPYHLSPVVPVMFALLALSSRRMFLSIGRADPQKAASLMLLLPVALLLVGVMKQEADALGLPLSYWEKASEPHAAARASIRDWLLARGGKHLVIVTYGSDHSPNQEWVYNGADLAGSRVIWARHVDEESDEALGNAFPDRQVWLLQADEFPQHVVLYRTPALQSSRRSNPPE